MGFKDLYVLDEYITDENNIPEEFYNRVLPETVLYQRAAGFFSSSAFRTISRGLADLYLNGGKIQILVSPQFSKKDIDSIKLGMEIDIDKAAVESILGNFHVEDFENDDGLNILAWLLYEKRLEIRTVVPKDKNDFAMFHDKFCIMTDLEDNKISFRGSANESENAFMDNYETIEVDTSFSNPIRCNKRESQFLKLWNNESKKWKTKTIPQTITEKLVKIRKPIESNSKIIEAKNRLHKIAYPSDFKLRDYQKNAIKKWVENKFNGVFEMATGTGKTKTAIAAISNLMSVYEKQDLPIGLVIVVPYKVLLEQWQKDLYQFNIDAIACYDDSNKWYDGVNIKLSLFNHGVRKKFFLITTNATFSDDKFQSIIQNMKNDFIFLVDEMHHFSSDNLLSKVPKEAKYKLGLSATLMSKYNNSNMNSLISYFGGIVYTFSMKEAIDCGMLTKYYYHPVFVELTDNERDDYYAISKIIAKMSFSSNDIDDNDGLKSLLLKRARLISGCKNKIEKIRQLKSLMVGTKNNIIYCGDKKESENSKFIDKVVEVVNNDIGIDVRKFTSEEKKEQRDSLISLLKSEIIDGLVAIRCLDEGVDIPSLSQAFILSSGTNPREYIQRRGRILRLDPNNKDKIAKIYDFVVVPSLDKHNINGLSEEIKKVETKLLLREFERFKEFASLAINSSEAYNEFSEIFKLYEV